MQPTPPEGMAIVSREDFFAFLWNDPRDIMPSNRSPDYTVWETRDRVVVGRSMPGWRRSGLPGEPKVYMLTEAARAAFAKATGRGR